MHENPECSGLAHRWFTLPPTRMRRTVFPRGKQFFAWEDARVSPAITICGRERPHASCIRSQVVGHYIVNITRFCSPPELKNNALIFSELLYLLHLRVILYGNIIWRSACSHCERENQPATESCLARIPSSAARHPDFNLAIAPKLLMISSRGTRLCKGPVPAYRCKLVSYSTPGHNLTCELGDYS